MRPPKVSVIVPTKDEEKNLPNLLQSLKKQTFKNFEVIIVDNHSKDKTIQVAKKYTRRILTAGPERSAQRNFGAKKAKGKFLLFIDADMWLHPQVINQCVELMEQNSNFSATIIPELAGGKGFWAKVKSLEKRIYIGEEIMEAARFFRRKDFLTIKGYKNNLIAGEDWDLSQRMEKLRPLGRISLPIFHDESRFSLIEDLRKKYYYAKHIKKYAKYNLERFKTQAGFGRLAIFFLHRHELFKDPIHAAGLLLLKSLQLTFYLLAKYKPK